MSFSTTTELAVYVERELGHQLTGASSQRADIISHLDRAHKIICAGGGELNYTEAGTKLDDDIVFAFARSANPKIITLLPAITTATVTATRNSTSITFGADPNSGTSIAGYFIRINSEDEIYRVSAHTASSTSATLDGAYVGDANVTSAACVIFKLQYDVGSSDILRLVSPLRIYNTNRTIRHINLTDKDELTDRYPMNMIVAGFPPEAAVVKETTGTLTIQFAGYPDDYERVELEYVPVPATLNTTSVDPLMPSQFRLTVAELALYFMAQRNNDDRASNHLVTARQMFRELVNWNERIVSAGDTNYGKILITGFDRKKDRIAVVRPFDMSN